MKALIFKIKNQYFTGIIAVLVIMNITLAIAALLKDIMLASYLGTTSYADALLLAYSIPDIIGNNLLAAAIGTACVPVFSVLYVKGENKRFYDCVKSTGTILLYISLTLFVLLLLFRSQIIEITGGGFSREATMLCIRLFSIMLPAIILFPAVTIGVSILQIFDRFIISSMPPIVFNFVFLASLVFCFYFGVSQGIGVYYIALSILAGIAVMVLIVWIPLYKSGVEVYDPKFYLKVFMVSNQQKKDFKMVFKLFMPYFLILFSSQSVLYVERYIASYMDTGSVAGLNYAYRLAQFPVWVFVSAVGTVVYPSMSKHKGLDNLEGLKNTFKRSLNFILLLTIPMSIILFMLRDPIISLLFFRGAFDAGSLKITADILSGYSLTIVGQAVMIICIRVLLSIREIYLPMLAVFFSAIVNIVLDFRLTSSIGIGGLGYGAACGSILNAVLMLLTINSKTEFRFVRDTLYIVKVIGANIVVLILAFIFSLLWNRVLIIGNLALQSVFVIAVLTICSIAYCAVLYHEKII